MKRALAPLVLLAFGLTLISCAAPQPTQKSFDSGAGPAAPPMPAATAAPGAQPFAGKREAASDAALPNAASAERMIVYNVDVSLEVQDTEKAVADLTALVGEFKGYVSAARMARDGNGQMRGTLTVRVPAESLDAAQARIEAIGLKVLSRNRTSNDVTDQYTDLNARLTNLEATEKELRELLATTRERTGKAEDILAIYNQLTNVRGQIEQIKGQMNVLSKTSAMATLTISLTPHVEVQVVDPEGWLPNQTAREALRALVQALQGLGDLAIWGVLFFLPVALVLALPFVIIALILRAVLQRRGKKKIVSQA